MTSSVITGTERVGIPKSAVQANRPWGWWGTSGTYLVCCVSLPDIVHWPGKGLEVAWVVGRLKSKITGSGMKGELSRRINPRNPMSITAKTQRCRVDSFRLPPGASAQAGTFTITRPQFSQKPLAIWLCAPHSRQRTVLSEWRTSWEISFIGQYRYWHSAQLCRGTTPGSIVKPNPRLRFTAISG